MKLRYMYQYTKQIHIYLATKYAGTITLHEYGAAANAATSNTEWTTIKATNGTTIS